MRRAMLADRRSSRRRQQETADRRSALPREARRNPHRASITVRCAAPAARKPHVGFRHDFSTGSPHAGRNGLGLRLYLVEDSTVNEPANHSSEANPPRCRDEATIPILPAMAGEGNYR